MPEEVDDTNNEKDGENGLENAIGVGFGAIEVANTAAVFKSGVADLSVSGDGERR